MKTSFNLQKDVLISFLYLSGVIGIMSGEVVLSTALICTASLLSMFHVRKTVKIGK
jgi:hypothetical protein